jgi:hypothetical protein
MVLVPLFGGAPLAALIGVTAERIRRGEGGSRVLAVGLLGEIALVAVWFVLLSLLVD